MTDSEPSSDVRTALPPGIKFTCMTCRVGFGEAEAHRTHFKSDWHRYNLKRKVASLHPVSAVEFQDRLLAQRNAALLAESELEEGVVKCDPCGKKFNTENAYRNHLASKKHKEAVKTAEARAASPSRRDGKAGKAVPPKDYLATPAPSAATKGNPASDGADAAEEADSGGDADGLGDVTLKAKDAQVAVETTPAAAAGEADKEMIEDEDGNLIEMLEPDVNMSLGDCLFCGTRSETLETNLEHMSKVHGFFIPDVEHLRDLSGLIAYLQDKVSRFHICLTCNGTGKGFWSTEAVRGHMIAKGHCFVNYEEEGQLELEEFYSFGDDEDDDWEDVDEEGDDVEGPATTPRTELVVDEGPAEGGVKGDMELYVKRHGKPAVVTGYDLVLPSGARAGHRSLKRFYRQKFASEDTRDSVVIQKLVSEYSAIGLPGFGPGSGAPTKEIRRDRDRERRRVMSARMRQGMANNKSDYTKHFREQNTQ
eukprot:m.86723 g.86723  ORF g.86723 m.86723 type:complete len:479 (+) comp9674_c2_seq2:101-1537(+)